MKHFSAVMAGSLAALCLFHLPLSAQATLELEHIRPADRIRGPIDDGARTTLMGSRHVLARPEYDAGGLAPDTRLARIQFALRSDDSQQQALEALLTAQQDPESPYYHHWLTPEEFGARFGVSDNDLSAVVNWLEGKGFVIEPVPAGRRVVVFSGTSGQVESAFHTQMRAYRVNGAVHHANATDLEIPAALAPVTAGLVSLNDFHSTALHIGPSGRAAGSRPDFTSGGAHYLAPADFATIYDTMPLYASSTDGTGTSIAIVGRSNINLSDVQLFRSQLGLPVKNPQVIVNGTNPGVLTNGDQDEAILDVEWAGAVARNSTVQLVVSASTAASDGVMLSAQYIVNQNLAPVMSMSFGSCEAGMGTAGNQFINALWQQAASQGISVFVAAGDSGAAGCDDPSAASASYGQAVNGLCSSPYSTCVGGTEFNDTANPALYWSPTNNSTTNASAVSYIPETAWNESSMVAGGSGLWATGGGASIVYTKPSWQTGTGVPSGNHRYVPDVALSAAGHDAYLVATGGEFYAFSGTSAATPSFAGLTALAVERQGARQGNVNAILYGMAAKQASGGSAVFHDVTTGNNSVKGVAGFSAGPGYDPVTGLGSVDANLMVNAWGNPAKATPSFQLAAAASTFSLAQGGNNSVKLSLTVTGGFNAAVALSAGSLPSGLTASFAPASVAAPGSGSSTLTLAAAAQAAPGTFNVTLTGTGGGVTQTITLAVIVASKCSFTLNPTSAEQPAGTGTYTVSVNGPAGCSWTAASNASWITITNGASGTAAGQVSYSLTANTGPARTGTITIAGLTFQVLQDSANFTLSAGSVNVGASGATGSVTLTAPGAKSTWTAKSNATWITIPSTSASGTGTGAVAFTVSANTASTQRTGTMTIAGLTFTVNQAAAQSSAACTYLLKPGAVTATTTGFTVPLGVIAPNGCTWSAVSGASWITVTAGASGTGNGTVNISVAPNTASTTRSGSVTIAGYVVTFTEAGMQGSHGSALRLGAPIAVGQ